MHEKNLIKKLQFLPKEQAIDVYYKTYTNGYAIEIDFENGIINYGKEIKSDSRTTQNFSQPENFVVLECVDRLLTKGYKPTDITLEKVFPAGHGHSGRLDIFVKNGKKPFLMIECKTFGKEFDKEFAAIQKDGGQLFTYFQNDTNTDCLMLYTSRLFDGKIEYKSEIIKIEDNYRNAGNVEDVYNRWNKITNRNGIFESWIEPYEFQNKLLTKKELQPLEEEDSGLIFNSFASVLRKHSVSDKPNAFNKIFNLFLAKIWDEQKRDTDELDFQWKEKIDDPVEFQIRLINLHKAGLLEFLRKEIAGISDDDFNCAPKDLYEKKKEKLKFNKIFDIKDVIDDESFDDNFRVLKEVVQLLEKYQIRYPRRQRHLSDFFERLLTTGLKQEAGQYFTPPPITRFIVRSLPIRQKVIEFINQPEPKLPAVIDYAAGSGHFLTEILETYQDIIDGLDTSDFFPKAKQKAKIWSKNGDPYLWAAQYIYGIEKDYRLVKVAKVGCYFYGDGLAQVFHADGLDSFSNSKTYDGLLTRREQFDVVVSNPPYSVDGFKSDLRNKDAKDDFMLYPYLTDKSSEIECLFVERTAQLLKEDGIAGIILPSSILSNTGIYTKTREILLQKFEIIAMTELGQNTFMATNTSTVVLFLRRRNDNKVREIKEAAYSLAEIYPKTKKDLTINGIEKPVEKYFAHTGETEINAEKLFYFILAYNQIVVLVKTGEKDAEKRFLGYEFSNRRGYEGIHPIERSNRIEDCTRLFDEKNLDNPQKASTYIHRAFNGDVTSEIDVSLQDNIRRVRLVDMLVFDRDKFEKTISTAVKTIKISTQWQEMQFSEIVQVIKGVTYSKQDQASEKTNTIILTADNITLNGKLEIKKEIYLRDNVNISAEKRLVRNDIFICFSSGSKEHLGKVAFIDKDTKYYAGGFMGIIRVKTGVEPKYIYQLLNSTLRQTVRDSSSGANINNLSNLINEIKIPLPPMAVQKKIVSEIEAVEKQEERLLIEIAQDREKIYFLLKYDQIGIVSDLCTISNEKINPGDNPDIEYIYLGLEHIESNTGRIIKNTDFGRNILSAKNIFHAGDVLYGKLRPYLNKVAIAEFDGVCSTDILVLKTSVPKLLKYILLSKEFVEHTSELMSGISLPRISIQDFLNQKIPIPVFSEQQKIVVKIENLEAEIQNLQKQQEEMKTRKAQILKKYL
ncbi:MAG: N-6 DNA methylase [Prevotellaceae bacterium]|nr:N-6 DNA methylase [Prevotellaceae bacterium]